VNEGGRRRFLDALAAGAGVAATGAAAWPFAAALLEPLAERGPLDAEAPWVEVASDRQVRDAPLRAELRVPVRDGFFTTLQEFGAVWLWRTAGGELRALSATCPHLGCGIGRDGRGGFACPCHDSRFRSDGTFVSGPSPRSMDPLPVRVEGGRVLVQALRYATGTKVRRTG
jgi:cytochrome b6-f complex iron-sulfur subunit/menaquinol-cytochrome c reductase iron-sulfur subunit